MPWYDRKFLTIRIYRSYFTLRSHEGSDTAHENLSFKILSTNNIHLSSICCNLQSKKKEDSRNLCCPAFLGTFKFVSHSPDGFYIFAAFFPQLTSQFFHMGVDGSCITEIIVIPYMIQYFFTG